MTQAAKRIIGYLSIGGWARSKGFSDAAATVEGRERLVTSTISLSLDGWPDVFDGIDTDCEYPVHGGLPDNGYRAEDRRNCTRLFMEYRQQLDERGQRDDRHVLLTAAVPAGRSLPRSTFALGEIAKILDFISVMSYDLYGSLRTGPTAPTTRRCGRPEATRVTMRTDCTPTSRARSRLASRRVSQRIGLSSGGRSLGMGSRAFRRRMIVSTSRSRTCSRSVTTRSPRATSKCTGGIGTRAL